MILAIFYLHQSSRYFQSSFKSVGLSGEVQNRFLRWQLWQPSCVSDQNDFSYFRSTSHPDAFYQVSSQLAFRFRRSPIDFQDSKDEDQLGFAIRMISTSFYLQVTLMLPTKFESISLSVQVKKRKTDFQVATMAAILDI